LNNTLPTVNAGLDTVLNCVRTSITLQATSTTAGATFAWSNGTNAANTTVSTANTYTVTATNPANGCTASDAVNVTLNNTPPNVNAGIDQVLVLYFFEQLHYPEVLQQQVLLMLGVVRELYRVEQLQLRM
jgi:hypothetical protein